MSLPAALGIIRDLSVIFEKLSQATMEQNTITHPFKDDALIEGVEGKIGSDMKILVDGKEIIAFYPLVKRVVLLGRSSIPLEMLQNCAHLFNQNFAREVCPKLNISSSIGNLQTAIKNIYLGRCVLGVAKNIASQQLIPLANQREVGRIQSLATNSGFAFFSRPIL